MDEKITSEYAINKDDDSSIDQDDDFSIDEDTRVICTKENIISLIEKNKQEIERLSVLNDPMSITLLNIYRKSEEMLSKLLDKIN